MAQALSPAVSATHRLNRRRNANAGRLQGSSSAHSVVHWLTNGRSGTQLEDRVPVRGARGIAEHLPNEDAAEQPQRQGERANVRRQALAEEGLGLNGRQLPGRHGFQSAADR